MPNNKYWGLDDFMNVTATGVTNAANLSLFMVNLTAVLLVQSDLNIHMV